MKKFNVAVIGLGLVGLTYGFDKKRIQPASHIEAIQKNRYLELIAVCDSSKKARDLFLEHYNTNANLYNDFTKLISDFNKGKIHLDIITIATPDITHFKILKHILTKLKVQKKQLIIFCEKPLTTTLASSKKIKELAKNRKFKIVVNHIRRWSKIWNDVFQYSKKLGKIEEAVFYLTTSPENKENSQLRDIIHLSDLINWLKIEKKVTIRRLSLPYFLMDFYLWGSKGKIEVLNVDEILNLYTIKKSTRYEGFKQLHLTASKKLLESYISKSYKEFVDYLSGKKSKLSTDINDAISAMSVFEKYIYQEKVSKELSRKK